MTDTVFALATPPGRSGVAVIRISGPSAFAAAARLCPRGLPPPRTAGLRWLEWNGERIDQALLLTFPGPGSFTGEDVVELQVHGSAAVIRELTRLLGGPLSLVPAGPGEFTRRALLNGRLSLAEVEGLGDLLGAETMAQQRRSVALFSGEAGRRAERWRGMLLRAMALYETMIDFVDDDVPEDLADEAEGIVGVLRIELEAAASQARSGAELRDGYEVALVGVPNSGKSSLVNYLAGRTAAIVSSVAGTTRDVIELRYDLQGLPATFLDMAGFRNTDDPVEREGVVFAAERASAAAMRVFLCDPEMVPQVRVRPGDLVRRGFSDLYPDADFSALTGAGVDRLLTDIHAELETRAGEIGPFTRERHAACLEAAMMALHVTAMEPEIWAEACRIATTALDELVGRIDSETVLSEIFSAFCIGK